MSKIAVLDQITIDKIAAGEVVERPSSIVKELVENAVDAGATAVTVEIKDGGKSFIRITDNGKGIGREEVPLAFLRHATSKISKVEDLEEIASLGFRGEALSSISAVAQVELITKTPMEVSGTRYVIEGGKEKLLEDVGAPDGTTFLVRNLFYNTPAREKFLKTAMTEGSYIGTLMEQLALSHPEISFKFMMNGQVKLHTSGNGNHKEVIYQIYGRDLTKELLEIQFENEYLTISGYIGKPTVSRGNRHFENYYVNGRYVKNRILTRAIEDAYKGFMMQHKFPFVSLQLLMVGNDLDVNVHPTKMEVRFSREQDIYHILYKALSDALYHKELIPEVSFDKKEVHKEAAALPGRKTFPEPFEKSRLDVKKGTGNPAANASAGFVANEHPFNKDAMVKKTQGADFSSKVTMEAASVLREDAPYKAEQSAMQSVSEGVQAAEGSIANNTTGVAGINADNEMSIDETKATYGAGKEPTKEATYEAQKSPIEKSLIDGTISPEEGTIKEISGDAVHDLDIAQMKQPSKDYHQTTATENQVGKEPVYRQESLLTQPLLSREARKQHRLIGQLFDTYWLVQYENSFYIIDQHAAHEKVLYERIVTELQTRHVVSQYISPPIILPLSLEEEALLKEHMDTFEEFGFEIEHFGGREYSLRAVPANLYGIAQKDLFLELLANLSKEGKSKSSDILLDRLATVACKAAVKGNQRLSPAEADQLIDELLGLDNPYHCPHGRPTIISMTKQEIEKKFKRII